MIISWEVDRWVPIQQDLCSNRKILYFFYNVFYNLFGKLRVPRFISSNDFCCFFFLIIDLERFLWTHDRNSEKKARTWYLRLLKSRVIQKVSYMPSEMLRRLHNFFLSSSLKDELNRIFSARKIHIVLNALEKSFAQHVNFFETFDL